jgi:hypothetical protein
MEEFSQITPSGTMEVNCGTALSLLHYSVVIAKLDIIKSLQETTLRSAEALVESLIILIL